MFKNMKKGSKGFTLTELIIVIVIIGILAAVLIPSLTRYIDSARDAAAKQEASTYVTALSNYNIEVRAGNLSSNINSFESYCDDLGLDSSNIITIDVITSNVTPTSMIIADSNTSYQSQGFLLWVKHNRMVAYNHNTGLDQVINLSNTTITFKNDEGYTIQLNSKAGFETIKKAAQYAKETNQTIDFNFDNLLSGTKELTSSVKVLNPDYTFRVISTTDKTCYIDMYTGTESKVVVPSVWFNQTDGIAYDVVRIYDSAFADNYDIVELELPSSLIQIDDYGFAGCIYLESVLIPSSIQVMGSMYNPNVFVECPSLVNIEFYDVVGGQQIFTNKDPMGNDCHGIFKKIGENEWSVVTGTYLTNIFEGVTVIDVESFYAIEGLVTISLPSTITTIKDGAFKYCSDLESINIPIGVTSIGANAINTGTNTNIYCEASEQQPGWIYNWCSSTQNPIYS